MFVLTSEITVGAFRFSGVHEVKIKRSILSVVESASFSVPARAAISENGKMSAVLIDTTSKFKRGQSVSIRLGYDGELIEEFRGFVKEVFSGNPVNVVCEGYSLPLRSNSIDINGMKSVDEFISAVTDGLTPETAIDATCDETLALNNVIPTGSSGFDLLNAIISATDNNLTCFFPEPGKLWCGLLHKAIENKTLPGMDKVVKFRPGYNALNVATLKNGPSGNETATVKYYSKKNNGDTLEFKAGKERSGKGNYEQVLNKVTEVEGLKELAIEKLHALSTPRLDGSFTAFLQPSVRPGNSVYIEGSNNFSSGTYLVESTEVTFGVNGGRRKIELGTTLNQSNL
ncbi:MAG: hypothetical protein KF744_03100 [Taibaiella sp.]|nr:hypothetical protein [Taibaiella sp.]